MDKKLRDRLVGGFGGAGGAMVLYGLFIYFASPIVRKYWTLWLPMELIGFVLVSLAVYFHFKKITVRLPKS